MACDCPANAARQANYSALSAAHGADAVEGALDSRSVVAPKVPHCLLRCLQVLPSDLHKAQGKCRHPSRLIQHIDR